MNDDLLQAATRALREETAAAASDDRLARARLMASLHQGRVKRRTRLAFVLPLAACLAGGTAFAAATGRLPAALRAIGQVVGYTARAPATASDGLATGARSPHAAAPTLPSASASALASPATVPLPASAGKAPAPSRGSARPSSPVPASSGPSTAVPPTGAELRDADGDLYRLAHEAHFVDHDYARALAAWEAYLRATPGGRLTTEAAYNRALCLLRLGRESEARTALEPFATGKLNAYRRREAQQLLDELH
jgi:TolA-binding protein